jgi:hypothetical protein
MLSLESDELRMWIDSSSNYETTDAADLAGNTKYHVVGVYDATAQTVSLYVNGVLEASTTTGTIPSSIGDDAGQFHLGAEDHNNTPNNFYDGHIDEARVYNRALTPTEVDALYDWRPGPVGYWPMDEGSGTTFFDRSGHGSNGTITGTGPYSRIPGKFGNAIQLNDENDPSYITITDPTDGHLDFGDNGSFTITAWINFIDDSYFVENTVAVGKRDCCGAKGYALQVSSGGSGNKLQLYVTDGSQTYTVTSATTVPSGGNTWVHAAVTFDPNDASKNKTYFNGVDDTNSSSGTLSSIDSISDTLNLRFNFGYYGQDIILDEVKIYNYVRSDQEIVEDMNGGHPTGGSPVGSATSYWKFDETSGTTAYDANDTNNNDLTLSSASWTTSGKYDSAWNGDGSVYLSRADDADFDVSDTDDYSISLWFKSDSASNPGATEYLFNKASATIAGYAVYANTSGQICFGIDDDTAWGPDVSSCSSADVYDNTWHHLAAIRDHSGADQTLVYVDGVLVDNDTDSTTATLANSLSLYVGDRDGTNNGDEFNGDLDEIRVFRSALTADQVKIVYNANSATNFGVGTDAKSTSYGGPGGDPPVVWLDLNENTGTTVYDKTGNGYNATLASGGNRTYAWSTGKYGAGVDFGGTNDGSGRDDYAYAFFADDAFDSLTEGSISFWFKPDDTGDSFQNIFVTTDGIAFSESFELGFDSTNNQIDLWSAGCTGDTIIGDATLPGAATDWHHVIYAESSSGHTLYIDGRPVTISYSGSSDASDTCFFDEVATGTTNYAIGQPRTSAGEGYEGESYVGLVDEFKIYDYALSNSQVAYEYNRGAPVGWWKMDDNVSGDAQTIADNSKNSNGDAAGNDGTTHYGANTTGMDCTVEGRWNLGCDLDGTDDYVGMTNLPVFNGVAQFSVSMWIYPTSLGTQDGIVDQWTNDGTSSTGNVFAVRTQNSSSDEVFVFVGNGDDIGNNYVQTSDLNLTNSEWQLLTIVYDGTQGTEADRISVYRNGRLASDSVGGGAIVIDTNTATTQTFDIGRSLNEGVQNNFDGVIDDVQIYGYALSSNQIYKIMNNNAAYRWGPNTGSP